MLHDKKCKSSSRHSNGKTSKYQNVKLQAITLPIFNLQNIKTSILYKNVTIYQYTRTAHAVGGPRYCYYCRAPPPVPSTGYSRETRHHQYHTRSRQNRAQYIGALRLKHEGATSIAYYNQDSTPPRTNFKADFIQKRHKQLKCRFWKNQSLR